MSFWKRSAPIAETNKLLEQRVEFLEKKVHLLEETLETLKKSQLANQRHEEIQENPQALETRLKALEEVLEALKNTQIAKQSSKDTQDKTQPLDTKVKVLEETLETLKSMQMSDQMAEFIRKKERTLKMTSLINSVSEKPALDFRKEEASITHLKEAKKSIDDQIKLALRNAGTFSDDYSDDPRYFNYEVEDGMTTSITGSRQEKNQALTKFIGKGLRITAYNGFETDRVIIPNEINGQPVISIGEKVFMNTTVSEVILPKSIKAILGKAFSGCKILKHIDLPETLEYLGDWCFAESSIAEISFPNSLKTIPSCCCYRCSELERINFGNQVEQIKYGAFENCPKLRNISLPDTLLDVGAEVFRGTAVTKVFFPSSVKKVSNEAFGSRITKNESEVVCAFLGKDTMVNIGSYDSFYNVTSIYCLPGSQIQQIAREHSIPIKPLSEFRMG